MRVQLVSETSSITESALHSIKTSPGNRFIRSRAARMVVAIDRAAAEPTDVKLTVGLFQVRSNAPSVVPAEVLFSIDLRYPDDGLMDRPYAERRPCVVELRQI